MRRLIDWVKNHKLAVLLSVILAYMLFRSGFGSFSAIKTVSNYGVGSSGTGMSADSYKMTAPSSIGRVPYPVSESAPAPDVQNRMVVQTSFLSFLVKNVGETIKTIKVHTESSGGYMVESNLSNPQDTASGQITIRLPSVELDETLSYFRTLAVKVISEQLTGRDVTDEYVDIDTKLKTLLANKSRFEEIMAKAEKIEDILRIQQQVFSLQDQIDSLKGRQNYLSQTAKMAKITIYLSTDEFALPYAPTDMWRPEVIFKTAVRSLIKSLRTVAGLLIWLVVYSVIWLPILLIFIYIKRKRNKNSIHIQN